MGNRQRWEDPGSWGRSKNDWRQVTAREVDTEETTIEFSLTADERAAAERIQADLKAHRNEPQKRGRV